jgi:hypothetical protein
VRRFWDAVGFIFPTPMFVSCMSTELPLRFMLARLLPAPSSASGICGSIKMWSPLRSSRPACLSCYGYAARKRGSGTCDFVETRALRRWPGCAGSPRAPSDALAPFFVLSIYTKLIWGFHAVTNDGRNKTLAYQNELNHGNTSYYGQLTNQKCVDQIWIAWHLPAAYPRRGSFSALQQHDMLLGPISPKTK